MTKRLFAFFGITLALSFVCNSAKAQNDDIYTSVGVDFLLPVQDFADVSSFGTGISARFDQRFYKSFSATVSLGYQIFPSKLRFDGSPSLDAGTFVNYIPVRLGIKYSINPSLYAILEGGIGRIWTSNDGVDEVKQIRFCYAPGFGVYFPTKWGRFDLSARIESTPNIPTQFNGQSERRSYFFPGLRLAYCFE